MDAEPGVVGGGPIRMTRPRLLDLFCGAGGAAIGYYRAGFDVTGVDIKPQPHYPFPFILGDALEYVREHGKEYDAIHASPPCQAYSIMRNLPWLKDKQYWDSIPPTKERLVEVGIPWVIENVNGSPLKGTMLCGTMFGLKQPNGAPEYRHRIFESSHVLLALAHPTHIEAAVPGRMLGSRQNRLSGITTKSQWKSSGIDRGGVGHPNAKEWGFSVGINWMDRNGLSQAIPPAYTEWIGKQLMKVVRL
jgi:DNA (cytosine-5)-methyltransferase 1